MPLDDAQIQALDALCDQGLALHRAGRIEEACRHYETVLSHDADHAPALHWLGVAHGQAGNLEVAAELIGRAAALAPADAGPHGNLAQILNRLGRHAEAADSAGRAVSIQPQDAAAHSHRGQALRALGRLAQALESYDHVAMLRPGQPSAHYNRGLSLYELGRDKEAVESLDRAVALDPAHASALFSRGLALRRLGRPAEALASQDRVLALRPDDADAWFARGNALCDLERPAEALDCFDRVLAVRPDDREAWSNRMVALRDLRRPEEALQSCDRALAIDPAYAEGHNNRGAALYEFQRLDDAAAAYDTALALKPDYAEALANRAVLRLQQRRFAEAMADLDRSLAIKPDNAEAHYTQAMVRLTLDDETRGWAQYEWRWRTRQFAEAARTFDAPLWLGREDLTGKSILIHAEQGLGDTLQFCRYVPAVASLGAAVVFEVQPGLERLMQRMDGHAVVVTRSLIPPPCDFQVPLMSLPAALAAGAGDRAAPYLKADPEGAARWAERLAGDKGLKVGICWAGGARPDQPIAHAIDLRRSLPLTAFRPLAEMPGVSLYSLQKGPPVAELQTWDGPPIVDLSGEWRDFADTADFVANLDLVIACDTSTAHLAGGLGKPVWLLNRFDTCWRWGHGHVATPWYPTARLFTQSSPGDWAGVIAEVGQALRPLSEL